MIFGAAATGFSIAGYFTLAYYRIIRADPGCGPRLRGNREGACQSNLRHPDARLLGVPNSVLGGIYYAAIAMFAGGLLRPPSHRLLMYGSWFTVALSAYLAYSLLVKIKADCLLCLAAHALNLAIAVMLTVSVGGF